MVNKENKLKCSQCKINDAKLNEVSIINKATKEKKIIYQQPICEPCAEELLKCQECKDKQAEHIINKDNSEIILCEDCKQKGEEPQEKCLNCQNNTKKGKFCNDKCIGEWVNDHFNSFSHISSDGKNDQGTRCKACKKKVSDAHNTINEKQVQELIQHLEVCSGEEEPKPNPPADDIKSNPSADEEEEETLLTNPCEKCQKNPQSSESGTDDWNFCAECLKAKNDNQGSRKKINCPICKKITCWNNLNACLVTGNIKNSEKGEKWEWVDKVYWEREGSCCSEECSLKAEEKGDEKHTCPGCKRKYGVNIMESTIEGDTFKHLYYFIRHHRASNKCFWDSPETKQKLREYRNKFNKYFEYKGNGNFSIKRSNLTLAELQECKRELLIVPPHDDVIIVRAFCFKENDNYDVEQRGSPFKYHLVGVIHNSIKKKQEEGEVMPQPNNNQPTPSTPSQSNLPQNNNQIINNLQQLQVYFQVNNIQSITQQPDGSLLITFNSNNSVAPNNNSTSPNNPANSANPNPANPSQPNPSNVPNQHIITNEQLTDKNSSSMGAEQRVMWKDFKDYLKAQNKNSLNKEELKQEIKRLETNTSTKRNHAPIIIGGGLILVGIIGLVILLLIKKQKNKTIK